LPKPDKEMTIADRLWEAHLTNDWKFVQCQIGMGTVADQEMLFRIGYTMGAIAQLKVVDEVRKEAHPWTIDVWGPKAWRWLTHAGR